ncbi:unnamed protein product, partial [Effrenium voratum]
VDEDKAAAAAAEEVDLGVFETASEGEEAEEVDEPKDVNMVEEEGESCAEAAPKKRRLQGKQAAPSYGPPLALPVIVVVGGAAFAGQVRDLERKADDQDGIEEVWREEAEHLRGPPAERWVFVHVKVAGADAAEVWSNSHPLVDAGAPVVHLLYDGVGHYNALVE